MFITEAVLHFSWKKKQQFVLYGAQMDLPMNQAHLLHVPMNQAQCLRANVPSKNVSQQCRRKIPGRPKHQQPYPPKKKSSTSPLQSSEPTQRRSNSLATKQSKQSQRAMASPLLKPLPRCSAGSLHGGRPATTVRSSLLAWALVVPSPAVLSVVLTDVVEIAFFMQQILQQRWRDGGRGTAMKARAFPSLEVVPLMATMVQHLEGQRDWVVTKSIWHLSDTAIKSFCQSNYKPSCAAASSV